MCYFSAEYHCSECMIGSLRDMAAVISKIRGENNNFDIQYFIPAFLQTKKYRKKKGFIQNILSKIKEKLAPEEATPDATNDEAALNET